MGRTLAGWRQLEAAALVVPCSRRGLGDYLCVCVSMKVLADSGRIIPPELDWTRRLFTIRLKNYDLMTLTTL